MEELFLNLERTAWEAAAVPLERDTQLMDYDDDARGDEPPALRIKPTDTDMPPQAKPGQERADTKRAMHGKYDDDALRIKPTDTDKDKPPQAKHGHGQANPSKARTSTSSGSTPTTSEVKTRPSTIKFAKLKRQTLPIAIDSD